MPLLSESIICQWHSLSLCFSPASEEEKRSSVLLKGCCLPPPAAATWLRRKKPYLCIFFSYHGAEPIEVDKGWLKPAEPADLAQNQEEPWNIERRCKKLWSINLRWFFLMMRRWKLETRNWIIVCRYAALLKFNQSIVFAVVKVVNICQISLRHSM